ncbi:hypothetical protein [Streptomyces sp. NPDC053431]|uniref:hypothetical protein n=1 Tax=Streptomyces sp. NPDC053431 TaxID=3365703 RepID=UPI0037D7309A
MCRHLRGIRRLRGARTPAPYPSSVPQPQAAGLVTGATRAALVGTGEPARTTATVRRHLGAFFGHHPA